MDLVEHPRVRRAERVRARRPLGPPLVGPLAMSIDASITGNQYTLRQVFVGSDLWSAFKDSSGWGVSPLRASTNATSTLTSRQETRKRARDRWRGGGHIAWFSLAQLRGAPIRKPQSPISLTSARSAESAGVERLPLCRFCATSVGSVSEILARRC